MDKALRDLVRVRGSGVCEYCRIPIPPFHVEHIIPRKHGGDSTEANLAWACFKCNLSKGPNLSGIDSETGQIVRLFHPRLDIWGEHFQLQGSRVIGLTSIGRVTVHVLQMNHVDRVTLRAQLILKGMLRE